MADKLPKSVVLYFSPALIGQNEGARCGKCIMFVPGKARCESVSGHIDSQKGVCGLYVHGEPIGALFGTIPKLVAGYSEQGPTHCGSCEYYGGGNKPDGPCEKVEGVVAFHGCCNNWEKK